MSNINIDEVLGAFSYARCDDYHSWLSVGLALYNEGYGCDVWDAWSRQSPKYRSGDCAVKWATFASESSSKLGVGSLVQWAKDDGNYKPSSSQAFGFNDPTSGSATAPSASHSSNSANYTNYANSSNSANITKTPIGELKEYLQAVFKAGDIVNFVVESFEKDGKHIPNGKGANKSLERLLSDCDSYDDIAYVLGDSDPIAGAWIRFNPMNGEGCKNSDVVDLRHCLIESDSLPKHEQLAKIKELNLPCSAIVDSGGKSIHAIVRIDAGKDEKLYRERVLALHAYLEQQAFPVDKSCKNPSRLSRIAGVSRNGKRQSLIATHIGANSYDQWQNSLINKELEKDLEPIDFGDLMSAKLDDMSDCLIGERFICREGSALIIAQSGSGKSTLALQMSLAFASGRIIWGLNPHKPRKVLMVQAENSFLDLAEPIQSIARIAGYNAEELALIGQNFKAFSQDSYSGDSFIKYFERLCEKFKPDLVMIDPFLSYLGGDVSKQEVCSKFLRNQLNPIIHKHKLATVLIHHTGKPKENANGTYNDFAYYGIGSSELVNWARAISVLVRNKDNENVFDFVHVKRGSRCGTNIITHLRQGTSRHDIYWYEADAPAKEIKTAKTKKSKYGFLLLDQLKPMTKEELVAYIETKLGLALMDNSYESIKKIINLARKEVLLYNEATKLWQGKYYDSTWATNETSVDSKEVQNG